MPLDRPADFDVAGFQRWMFTIVTHPDGVEAGDRAAAREHGVGIAAVVLPSNVRNRQQRMGVYAEMYFNRLIEILFEDYPTLAYAMGDEGFYQMAHAYLIRHPSRSQRLVALGRHLSDFLLNEAQDIEAEQRPFLAELARLELALELVFHGKHADPLGKGALANIPPEQWADARLQTVPALDLLETTYPVNAYFRAVKNDEEPELPSAEPSWMVMWRKDYVLWRANLTAAQYTILSQLRAGATLGDALMACTELPDFDPDHLMASVGGWFEEWTADGLFTAVSLPGSEQDQ